MKKTPFKVALLISTYKWPEALQLVLQSVLYQSRQPDEIIIAEDGDDTRTAWCIGDFKKLHSIPVKHVYHEDRGFRKSLILNKAIKEIESDYIIEIDGDIIMHRNFIADHINAAKTGYFVQGSRTMLTEWKSKLLLKTRKINRLHPLMKGLYSRFNAVRMPLFSSFFKVDPYSSHNVKGCNLAFWKGDYVKVNGYYSGFEGWGWEDYEFGERLINVGVKKKRVKMAAIGYHIFHPLSSRANFVPNELIYRETVQFKYTYRPNGYVEA
ncbi:glycosyltransferase family 2 protein [Niabella sp.]|uniref:glycosyltransferase family 2 protein n=1 Tax=Niabella sp. TaxID=1962976 RepID=UPI002610FE3B|nr:glycosyltransferase family 2 protein [Niabella sp.]